jgi:hypothetical protein
VRSDSIRRRATSPKSAPEAREISTIVTCPLVPKAFWMTGKGGATPQARCPTIPATSAGKITE